MLNDKWLIIAFLSISLNICAETSSAIDTINFIGNPKKIKLKNQFIVASSLEFIGSKTKVNPIEIRPIKGEVFLEASIIAQQIIMLTKKIKNITQIFFHQAAFTGKSKYLLWVGRTLLVDYRCR